MPKETFNYIDFEKQFLAPYAARAVDSKSRAYPEPEHPYRSPYQRDRDRVIHSSAFRRLEAKTQVFVPYKGDYYRNRLTHTIEVAQISRTVSSALRLNSELSEAVALAHDIGHSPFGHVGESVLNSLMKKHGGFEHNRQSLRIVDVLESRYPDFPGLNLTYEVREGIAKHSTIYDSPGEAPGMDSSKWPTLEAQVVNLADEITYSCHDVDDGLKSGILKESDLHSVKLPSEILGRMKHPALLSGEKMRRYQLVRMLIDRQVSDLVDYTENAIRKSGVEKLEDVRNAGCYLVSFSPEMAEMNSELKSFLMKKFYRHPHVVESTAVAKRIISGLFEAYLSELTLIPADIREKRGDGSPERIVCDYIAGMTDRFAFHEYDKTVARIE